MNVPSLASDAVHLWWIDLWCSGDDQTILAAEERERAARLRQPDEQGRWIAARAALRQILARYVGAAPQELALLVGAHGKPALAAGTPRFNLSHAGERALLAVSQREVGVDLEPVAGRMLSPDALPPLLATVCSAEEARQVLALPAEEQQRAFLRYWVLKEAYAKGIGIGLGGEVKLVNFHAQPLSQRNPHPLPPLPSSRERGVRQTSCHPASKSDVNTPSPVSGEGRGEGLLWGEGSYEVDGAPEWTLRLLDAGADWAAALAVRGQDAEIVARRWLPGEGDAR